MSEHPESKLVHLLNVCLLLKIIPLWPRLVWMKCFPICILVEIPLSLILLESSIIYIWKPLQEYLLLYSDDILVYMYEDTKFEWIICPLCCGKSGCSEIFTSLLLKIDALNKSVTHLQTDFNLDISMFRVEIATTIWTIQPPELRDRFKRYLIKQKSLYRQCGLQIGRVLYAFP
ncbi:jg13857 [Pararge aegeria aegeria]|uniref:Jg13857 protein n=1 Tax=Pararge aegeria aegeria TaxID=348720 RepID=A0A8S4S9D8_9NEOP|nr:jg13857 [Pararge aegeria aegeria]